MDLWAFTDSARSKNREKYVSKSTSVQVWVFIYFFFSHISFFKSPVGSTSFDEEHINTKKAASAPPKFGATWGFYSHVILR